MIEREAPAPRPLDTGCHRADNAPMRGKSREERIALMSQAERDDLMLLARKVRGDARRDALQAVVEAAYSFHTEQERQYGHVGRLKAREYELCAAIVQAAEVIDTDEVTDDDLLIALAVWDDQQA